MRNIDTNSSIRQRMLQLCDYLGVSPNKLSEDSGLNRNYVSRLKDVISSDLLRYLYRNYDNVSIEWILTGNGKMLLPDTDEQQNLNKIIDMLNLQLQRTDSLEKELKDLKSKLSNVADIAVTQ